MALHFVSLNKPWCEEIRILFPDAKVSYTDVTKISVEDTAFVSPANCLGFMDGGIDHAYSRTMFPGCEKKVRDTIKDLGFTTGLGRPYLPIGSAFAIPVGEKTSLICAPTMFLPHDVSTTQNAYWSFLAALQVFKKLKHYKTLVVTSHCCGYGKMSPVESAKQMKQAYDDFLADQCPKDSSTYRSVVLLPNIDEEQPDNYDNREIKTIVLSQPLAQGSS